MKTVIQNPADDSLNSFARTLRTQSEMRKRWLYILPAVFITYSLAYLDRTNYGFGAAAGLAQTLHISSSQSALLGALFFFGYFLFQIPGAAYARRRSARRLIFFALVSWGILASLTGIIRNFWLLALDRLLLGAAESFILPAMLILLTNWFTRAERSRTGGDDYNNQDSQRDNQQFEAVDATHQWIAAGSAQNPPPVDVIDALHDHSPRRDNSSPAGDCSAGCGVVIGDAGLIGQPFDAGDAAASLVDLEAQGNFADAAHQRRSGDPRHQHHHGNVP